MSEKKSQKQRDRSPNFPPLLLNSDLENTAMKSLTTIPFHDTTLFAIEGDAPEAIEIVMRPVVTGMGLDWQKQSEKIKAHPILGPAYTLRYVQLPADAQAREYGCLALNRINFWLATINPARIKNETVREAVIMYQTEVADVLFQHFFGPLPQKDETTLRDMDAADLNARIGASRHAMRLWGKSAGAWTWKASGLPVPPKHLLTHSQQAVLDLVDGRVLEEV